MKKNTQNSVTWCKLTVIKTTVESESIEQPARYYTNKHAAIVIGSHEGEGNEKFRLETEEIWLDKNSLYKGRNKDGQEVEAVHELEAQAQATNYIYTKLSFAEKEVLRSRTLGIFMTIGIC